MSTAKKLQNKLFGGGSAQPTPTSMSRSHDSLAAEPFNQLTISLDENPAAAGSPNEPSPAGSGSSTPVPQQPQQAQQQQQQEALRINIPGAQREKERSVSAN